MIEAIASVALVAVALALRMTHSSTDSPDCRYYSAMAYGEVVPAPYARRVVVPLVARIASRVFGVDPPDALGWVSRAGTAASVAAVFLATLSWGGSPLRAAAASLIFIGTDSAVFCWVILPRLVDSWAVALALFAAIAPWPIALALLILAAGTKEIGLLMGAIFICVADPSHAWVALPGLCVFSMLAMLVRRAPPDTEVLRHPIRTAFERKRQGWLSFDAISGMKLTPFVAGAWLASSALLAPVAAVVTVSILQVFAAVDHGRLIALSAAFLIPATVVVVPEWAVAPWALLSLCWPAQSRII